MEQHVSQVLNQNPFPKLTPQEVLAAYSHIELTQDEYAEAMIEAKRKKEKKIAAEEESKKINERRGFLTQKTNYDLVKGLTEVRKDTVFNKQFVVDDTNAYLFELLLLYFGQDKNFIPYAMQCGVKNPDLDKGILICGNFGVGKSWMTKMFSKNQRQCYEIKNAKDIAIVYKNKGEEAMEEFLEIKRAAFEDPSVFYQKQIGLCIEDFGTEDIKSNYGDKKNVLGDIIEQRYFKGNMGIFLHGTTNLTADQLKAFYGERVTTRMREKFNFIELKGTDRRK